MQHPIYMTPVVSPDWEFLSANSSDFAIQLLTQFPKNINWYYLSQNSADGAIDLLDQNPGRIYPYPLAKNTNPRAKRLFEKYSVKKYWSALCANTADYALDWLEANPDNIDWYTLSRNPSPRALALLENNRGRIHMRKLCSNPSDRAIKILPQVYCGYATLSSNPAALDILLQYPDKINWNRFSANPSPGAIQYLIDHPDKIRWDWMFMNTSDLVVPLLREYIYRQKRGVVSLNEWCDLCRYHAQDFREMFPTLDYAKMRKRWAPLKEELETVVLSPDFVSSISARYGIDFKTVLQMHGHLE